jgi:PAS domain S-box-containing protein
MSSIALSSQSEPRSLFPPWLNGKWGFLGIIFIVYILLNLLWTFFHWGGSQHVMLISNLLSIPPSLLASAIAWRVAVQASLGAPIRRAWFLLGLSFFMFLTGNLVWAYLEVYLNIDPFPSLADVFYLAFYPFAFWGLLTLPGATQSPRERLAFWLDLLSVLIAATMFVGYFIIVPTAASSNDLVTQIIAPIYPIGSLFLIGGILAILYRRPSANAQSALSLLLIGMLFFVGGDFAFGYSSLIGTYTPGGWTDASWNVAQLFFALAALRKMVDSPNSALTQRWITLRNKATPWLPIIAVVLAYGLVFYVLIVNDGRSAEWLMAGVLLLTLLIIIRQIVSPAFTDLPIRVKVILTFVMVSVLSVFLVAATAYLTMRANLEFLAGQSLKAHVEIQSQTLGNEISKQFDLMEGFVFGKIIEEGANASNAQYKGSRDTVTARLEQQDLAWNAALDTDPLVQNVLNNNVTEELYELQKGFPTHTNLLLTDKFGATIAATARPETYSQATEEWWQAAYNQGRGALYVGNPTYDPDARALKVIIAVPVHAHLKPEVIGILRTTYRVDNVFEVLAPSRMESASGFDLLLAAGTLLTAQGDMKTLDPGTVARLQTSMDADYVKLDFEGTLHLVSQARVSSPDAEDADALHNLNWILINHKDPAAVFAPLHAAWRTALLTTLFVLLLTSGVAVILSQLLIAPISRLTRVAAQIAAGDLSTQARVESRDEVGRLASTFNTMLEALSHAQQELRENEALYRNLVEYSPDMILLQNHGKVLFVNPAGVKLLGANSAQELIGQSILDLIPAQELEFVQNAIRQIQETREPSPLLQQKMYRVDGASFESEFRAIPLLYAGEPAIQLVARDITERKRAEEQIHQLLAKVEYQKGELELRVEQRTTELNLLNQRLQEELVERQRSEEALRISEKKYRTIFENVQDVFYTTDYQGHVVTISPSIEKHSGYLPEEIIGKHVRTFFLHEESYKDLEDAVNLQGMLNDYEMMMKHKDGSLIYTSITAGVVSDGTGQPVGTEGVLRNITERQRLVQSLRESEEQFRILFEASPDAIFLLDPHDSTGMWRIIDCNLAACQLNGYTREELIGRSINLLNVAKADPAEFAATYERIQRDGALYGVEAEHVHKDGHTFPIEYSTSIITIGGNEFVLGIDRDITERRHAELALQEAKELAEAGSRAKSEFLSRMSHELRTPMNAILGFAQLLDMSRKEPLTSIQKERVKQIVKGGQHLLELINEILDISRIEANRLQISPEPVSIRESIQEALDLTTPLAVKRHIQVVAKLGGAAVNSFVMADRQRLKQVLLNLLGNAVKYNYDGGSVIITCEETPANTWRISIADTGPGIEPKNLARLFLPFERLVAEQSNVEGTGLGLTLAKRLVELMQGQIGVKSAPGRGSTFWIELPRAESLMEHLQRSGGTGALPEMSATIRTILYVEDNVANFELIQEIFAEYSQIELLWAPDGKSGIETARQRHPSLILLDLHLGVSDGAEVLQQLKQEKGTAEIPVVIVSADATSSQAERLISLGAHSYLTKPLNVKHFVQLIDELLGQKEF